MGCTGVISGAGGGGAEDDPLADEGGGGSSCCEFDGGVDDSTRTLTRVTLHPIHPEALGPDTLVAFGAPFPRGALASTDKLVVRDIGGAEIASHVEELVAWRSLGDDAAPQSVRSALVYVRVDIGGDVLELDLVVNGKRGAELGPQVDPRTLWVNAAQSAYPTTLREPAVYATFPAAYLGDSELRSRTSPVGSDPSWTWYDDFVVGASHTAVNDVPASVTRDELIDVTTYSPWLFDRSMTLFNTYIRTGDVDWLRQAHLATQFYAQHVGAEGYFDLKDSEDLKYSYGQSPLLDLMLTGDRSHLELIERVADAAAEWDPEYEMSRNFWTERHQAYALLGALSAWEATGSPVHAARARLVAEASFKMASSPKNGWKSDGCMMHSFRSHEGFGSDDAICSPWMSALFADAAFRYFLHSRDPEALRFLAGLGDYAAKIGTYDGSPSGVPHRVPWYLASSMMEKTDNGAFDDIEHTCDVAGMVVRAAWARKKLGENPASLIDTAEELIDGCKTNLSDWYRPTSTTKPVFRISPARKFNWWFGTNSDMPRLWAEVLAV